MVGTDMEDLSLHILDVVENSIEAGARRIRIQIIENSKRDRLKIEIQDDGKGMDQNLRQKALDPFFTTKSVRRVGLGLSLFREAARMADGDLSIESKAGQGTSVKATFQYSHVDRNPLGDMAKTMMTLAIGHPEIQFVYFHQKNGRRYSLDTTEFRGQGELISGNVVDLKNLFEKNWRDVE